MDDAVSEDVAAFLADHVETYEELELLLLLREHRGRAWTIDDAATRLGIRPTALEPAFTALRDAGLLRETIESRGQEFTYAPCEAHCDLAVAALASTYAADRLAIVRHMNANAIERIRTAAMRTFADSFVIGKGRKDG